MVDVQLSVTSVADLFFTTKSHDCAGTRSSRPSSLHTLPSHTLAAADGPRAQRLRVRLGSVHEQSGLDKYSAMTNSQVTDRNTRKLSLTLDLASGRTVQLHGRPDGICDNIVVEHKRRSRGLLHYVPLHESVQCHLYMKMLGFDTAHLVETFANAVHIHVIKFEDSVWDKIVSRICKNRASDFSSAPSIEDTRTWKNVSPRASSNSAPFESRPSDEPTFF